MLTGEPAQERGHVLVATEEDLGVLGLERQQALVGARLAAAATTAPRCAEGSALTAPPDSRWSITSSRWSGLPPVSLRTVAAMASTSTPMGSGSTARRSRTKVATPSSDRPPRGMRSIVADVAELVVSARQRQRHQARRPCVGEVGEERERSWGGVLEVVEDEQHRVGRRGPREEADDGG